MQKTPGNRKKTVKEIKSLTRLSIRCTCKYRAVLVSGQPNDGVQEEVKANLQADHRPGETFVREVALVLASA